VGRISSKRPGQLVESRDFAFEITALDGQKLETIGESTMLLLVTLMEGSQLSGERLGALRESLVQRERLAMRSRGRNPTRWRLAWAHSALDVGRLPGHGASTAWLANDANAAKQLQFGRC